MEGTTTPRTFGTSSKDGRCIMGQHAEETPDSRMRRRVSFKGRCQRDDDDGQVHRKLSSNLNLHLAVSRKHLLCPSSHVLEMCSSFTRRYLPKVNTLSLRVDYRLLILNSCRKPHASYPSSDSPQNSMDSDEK